MASITTQLRAPAYLPRYAITTVAAIVLALVVGRSTATALSEQSIDSSPATASASPPAAVSASQPAARDEAPETTPLPPPRATFPYAIREGDTLGAIASRFGLSVADLTRVNHVSAETELDVGRVLRIPNPAIARERELTAEITRLERATEDAANRARTADRQLAAAGARVSDLQMFVSQARRDLRFLNWWRGAAYLFGGLAILTVGAMLLALIEWWLLRSRFRAVAEMNESLRRLDYRYRGALAKAELRLQELYGRRRRGLHDSQERPKLAEEAELERLNRELKALLERELERLGPPGAAARRARWRVRIAGIGSPAEARSPRR